LGGSSVCFGSIETSKLSVSVKKRKNQTNCLEKKLKKTKKTRKTGKKLKTKKPEKS
jgi:hypothetical protein